MGRSNGTEKEEEEKEERAPLCLAEEGLVTLPDGHAPKTPPRAFTTTQALTLAVASVACLVVANSQDVYMFGEPHAPAVQQQQQQLWDHYLSEIHEAWIDVAIRDFNESHADFESDEVGFTKGLVQQRLGVDR